jgi:hypothetical protein
MRPQPMGSIVDLAGSREAALAAQQGVLPSEETR